MNIISKMKWRFNDPFFCFEEDEKKTNRRVENQNQIERNYEMSPFCNNVYL